MEGMATGVGLFELVEPIMLFFYQRRNFTQADALQDGFILKMYVVGMWAYCSYQILVRSFYACKDTKTPMQITCVLAVTNLIMLYFLVWVPGIGPGAFGLSTTITFVINAGILIAILRKRLGAFGAREIFKSVGRSLIACAVMAAVVYALRYYMSGAKSIYVLLVCIPAGAAAFAGTAWILRAPEIKELMARPGRDSDTEPVTTNLQ
jgi:putative peptidoglycan lipid II flippase